jgi:hypothetical protein
MLQPPVRFVAKNDFQSRTCVIPREEWFEVVRKGQVAPNPWTLRWHFIFLSLLGISTPSRLLGSHSKQNRLVFTTCNLCANKLSIICIENARTGKMEAVDGKSGRPRGVKAISIRI